MGSIDTTCCIAGGGPAGMMAGFLLARAGIDVVVLEKHADFLRDFRGDTIHPSTLELMAELGLLNDFLRLPHQRLTEIAAQIGADRIRLADFSHLPTRCKFIALMPQWDFLNFLAERALAFPRFRLLMQSEATGLFEANGRVSGVAATGPDGPMRITSRLVIAADGRGSVLRSAARLPVENLGAPMDVLWFRLPRLESDLPETFGTLRAGRMAIQINRGDYWQCAYLIAKGEHGALKARGLEAFRAELASILPVLAPRVEAIGSWADVKLLTVKLDRLRQWSRPGLICIGDAAHAMSPIAGVGINLAIQDAVAAANALAGPLSRKEAPLAVLAAIEKRRRFPTRLTQGVQRLAQDRIIDPVLRSTSEVRAPWLLRMIAAIPLFRLIPAYLVGVGARPEHIRTPYAPD